MPTASCFRRTTICCARPRGGRPQLKRLLASSMRRWWATSCMCSHCSHWWSWPAVASISVPVRTEAGLCSWGMMTAPERSSLGIFSSSCVSTLTSASTQRGCGVWGAETEVSEKRVRLQPSSRCGVRKHSRQTALRISFNPSMTLLTSSTEERAILRPILAVESVRIWLILIHDLFGSPGAELSSVRGNPARGSWLVSATAMTVPERSLKTSSLSTRTGRSPACSLRRVGSRSAQRISPLSMRATTRDPPSDLRRRIAAPRPDRAWRTRGRASHG